MVYKFKIIVTYYCCFVTEKPKKKQSDTKRSYRDALGDYAEELERHADWTMGKAKRDEIDRRSQCLGGEANWVRSNLKIMKETYTLKCHDWILLVQSATNYIFKDLFDDPAINSAVARLMNAFRACLTVTSTVNEGVRDYPTPALKLQMIEAIVQIEDVLPRSEMTMTLHSLTHIADQIHIWGSGRSLWTLWGER